MPPETTDITNREDPPLFGSRMWLPRFWWERGDKSLWCEGPLVSAPEEAEEWMKNHFKDSGFIIVEVTRHERVVDASQMAYDATHPLARVHLRRSASGPS